MGHLLLHLLVIIREVLDLLRHFALLLILLLQHLLEFKYPLSALLELLLVAVHLRRRNCVLLRRCLAGRIIVVHEAKRLNQQLPH